MKKKNPKTLKYSLTAKKKFLKIGVKNADFTRKTSLQVLKCNVHI